MNIKAGLVGLPNVGKSTLFNALTKAGVPAANYPFCTIEPHIAITHVPDERLAILATIYRSQKIVPADVMFVDIAGLVKGAASGEGLGNQFLSNIREVNLIIHVIRCFDDPHIIHTSTQIDPLNDYEIVLQELMLKDVESINKRLDKIQTLMKAAQQKPAERKQLEAEQQLLMELLAAINTFDAPRIAKLVNNAATLAVPVTTIPLLSAKNFIIVANLGAEDIDHEHWHTNVHYQALVKRFGADRVIPLCVKLEEELAQLPTEQAQALMHDLGLRQSGLAHIITTTYRELGLITFFTCGPQETHAWPIIKGTTIKQAAGEIHSDFERGFICAEVINCAEVIACGSEQKAKTLGKVRTEGSSYITTDGDIVLIRFNV
jgi:GTP-binding protein YchF